MGSVILRHVWGISPAVDRVWAQVAGMGSRADKRVFMLIQAFMDESYTNHGKNDSFVLAGCIATAETWANFVSDWDLLLPEHGQVDKLGRRYFHCADIPSNNPAHELFWRVIEKHVPALVSCQFYLSDFHKAMNRLYYEETGGRPKKAKDVSPYTVAFFCLMNTFHNHLDKMTQVIPLEEKVDFYFDNNPEHKGFFQAAWDNYMRRAEEDNKRHLYGIEPRYEDDKDFKPLQAADFWASWVRRWYDEGGVERVKTHKFDNFERLLPKRLYIDINWDEDGLAELMSRMGEGKDREGNWHRVKLAIMPKA
jgi:Protein of unknown function (DUF3800)